MGYSIPSNKARNIISTLSSKETRSKVSDENRGYLGIQAKTIDAATAEAYGMVQGVYVYKIVEGTAAASSDLQEKDIIVKFDDQSVTSFDDLQNLLGRYSAGETINLTVKRPNGSTYDEKVISITLTENPEKTSGHDSGSQNPENSESAKDSEKMFREFIQGLPQFYMK